MRAILAVAIPVALGACAQSTTMPLAQDTVQITTNASPMCGTQGTQKVAMRQAAIETLRRGYDRFIITGSQYQQSVQGVVFTGNTAMLERSNDQGLVVKMFKANDAQASNALDAKTTLGPKWQEAVASPHFTCMDD